MYRLTFIYEDGDIVIIVFSAANDGIALNLGHNFVNRLDLAADARLINLVTDEQVWSWLKR